MSNIKKKLKSLVKECLFEILTENLIDDVITQKLNEMNLQGPTNNLVSERKQVNGAQMQQFKSVLDKVSYGEERQQKVEKAVIGALDIKDNDPMKSIFEDTLRTTVQEQASAGKPGGGGGPRDGGIDISKVANPNWKIMAGIE